MNNWKELKEGFTTVHNGKLKISLHKNKTTSYYGGNGRESILEVEVHSPSVSNCNEYVLVYRDFKSNQLNPWIHYSEKVEADLNEFIGIKLAEQREREELEKLSSEERARLEKEKVSRILDSY